MRIWLVTVDDEYRGHVEPVAFSSKDAAIARFEAELAKSEECPKRANDGLWRVNLDRMYADCRAPGTDTGMRIISVDEINLDP